MKPFFPRSFLFPKSRYFSSLFPTRPINTIRLSEKSHFVGITESPWLHKMSNCAVGLFSNSAVTRTNSHPPLYYYHPPGCILIVQCITKPIVHYLFRRQCIIFKFLGFNISPQGGGLLNYITLAGQGGGILERPVNALACCENWII